MTIRALGGVGILTVDPCVVVITGGAGGIGLAIGEAFVRESAKVHLLDVDGDRAQEQGRRLSKDGLEVTAGAIDVTDATSVALAVEDVRARHGRVDVLCNNAGIADSLKTIEEIEANEWDHVFSVNARGPFLMSRAVIPDMRARQQGVIINVASVAGLVGGVSGAAYTASKHAVIGLTRNVAAMYARDGIRCNAICPGGIDSGMRLGSPANEILDERVARIRSTQPRRGLPSEIASIAVFLASDDSSFVNGSAIVADGGWISSGIV